MNNPGPDHVRLVGHQDHRLLPLIQLEDLLEKGVRHSQGTLVIDSTNNNKPLWAVLRDQPLQLLSNILSQSQTIFFIIYRDFSIGVIHK